MRQTRASKKLCARHGLSGKLAGILRIPEVFPRTPNRDRERKQRMRNLRKQGTAAKH